MLSLPSRFLPWGRPFAPLPFEFEIANAASSNRTTEEDTPLNAPGVGMLNSGTSLVLLFDGELVLQDAQNLVVDSISRPEPLMPFDDDSLFAVVRPPNAGPFSATCFYRLWITAYTLEGWTLLNSTDPQVLSGTPSFKVSRATSVSNTFTISGSAQSDS